MLNLIGTIAGNVLSLPGVLGLALGLATRNPALAAAMGAFVGVIETMIFAHFTFADVEVLELTVAIAVGLVAGLLGCAIRRKGAVV